MNLNNTKQQFIITLIIAAVLLFITACAPTTTGSGGVPPDDTVVEDTATEVVPALEEAVATEDVSSADIPTVMADPDDAYPDDADDLDDADSDDMDDPDLDVAGQVAIYSAVVRQIVETDDTFGGTLEKPVVYILSWTNDAAGDPSVGSDDPEMLSPEVQEGITAALSDLSSTITWIESRDDLEFEENGSITGEGVLVTLGNIHDQDNGEVTVGGSIYVGDLAAGGKTYVLANQNGTWAITGTTGLEWIS